MLEMGSVDSDLRFMALNDLATEINKTSFSVDAATENLLVDQVLALLSDVNAGKSFLAASPACSCSFTEVKNQAVKAYVLA
jgi:hypothetical protein